MVCLSEATFREALDEHDGLETRYGANSSTVDRVRVRYDRDTRTYAVETMIGDVAFEPLRGLALFDEAFRWVGGIADSDWRPFVTGPPLDLRLTMRVDDQALLAHLDEYRKIEPDEPDFYRRPTVRVYLSSARALVENLFPEADVRAIIDRKRGWGTGRVDVYGAYDAANRIQSLVQNKLEEYYGLGEWGIVSRLTDGADVPSLHAVMNHYDQIEARSGRGERVRIVQDGDSSGYLILVLKGGTVQRTARCHWFGDLSNILGPEVWNWGWRVISPRA